MKIHRFIDNFDLSRNEVEITGEIAHQMAKVIKLEIGEQVELCDGKGISAMAYIEKIIGKNVTLKLDPSSRKAMTGDTKTTSLFCAVLKKENFELVVQKATECGISKIIPVITTRTVKMGLNMERLQKIAKEASEQSGRSTVPEISEPINFTEALSLVTESENIFFDASGKDLLCKMPCERDETEKESSFEKCCAGCRAEHSKFSAENYTRFSKDNSLMSLDKSIWIGPEGGWTPEEIEKAKKQNFKIASLGTLTLRGETAAIIATYLIVNGK